jgi:hypothetical protein
MNEDQRVNAAPDGSHYQEEQRREEPSAAAKRQRILPQTLLTGKAEEEVLMPFVLPPRTRLYIAETPEQCVEIGKKMLSVCKGGTSAWGFDIEWAVTYAVGAQAPTALIQFHRGVDAILFHVARCGLCEELVEILSTPTIFKVGISISGDKSKLERDFPQQLRGRLVGFVDVRTLFERGCAEGSKPNLPFAGRGLSDYVRGALGCSLVKEESLRRGNWNASLTREMKMYAAVDAYAASALFQFLQKHLADCNIDFPALLRQIQLPASCSVAFLVDNGGGNSENAAPRGGENQLVPLHHIIVHADDNWPLLKVCQAGQKDELPIYVSTWLDQFGSVLIQCGDGFPSAGTVKSPSSAKTSAMHDLINARGTLSLEHLATARGIKLTTVASYLVECVLAQMPYVFAYFGISRSERDFIIRGFTSFFLAQGKALLDQFDGTSSGLTGDGGKSRRYLFQVLQLLRELENNARFPAPPLEPELGMQYYKVQVVDAHLYRLFGLRYWESRLVP